MKKHQLAAMVLSALSAGILISCTKPNEDAQTTAKEQDVAAKETPTKPTANSNNTNNGVTIKTINIDPNTAESYLTEVANNQILTAYQNVVKVVL